MVLLYFLTLIGMSNQLGHAVAPLFSEYGLIVANLSPSALLSLLLASDPFPYLQGRDRFHWLQDLLPLLLPFADELRSAFLPP